MSTTRTASMRGRGRSAPNRAGGSPLVVAKARAVKRVAFAIDRARALKATASNTLQERLTAARTVSVSHQGYGFYRADYDRAANRFPVPRKQIERKVMG
jgi:hypothetical protein